MYLLLAGNDTVPTLICRGGGMQSTVCRIVYTLVKQYGCLIIIQYRQFIFLSDCIVFVAY